MKGISDNLFLFLTLNIVNNDHDIDDFVNRQDGKIYLVKGRDRELYFIINGKFNTTSDNEIDYSTSDACVFGRNSRTDKVTPLDTKKLKECIEEVDLIEYVKELKLIFFDYVKSRKIKDKHEIRAEFYNKVKEATSIFKRIKHGPNEELLKYAERIAKYRGQIEQAQRIIQAKEMIEKLWMKALYNPEASEKIYTIINKIMLRFI